jgi:ABC-2 type transport system permease protein
MQAYWTLTRRELAGYFVSLTGYVVIAAATFLLGAGFVVLLKQMQGTSLPVPLTEVFFTTWVYLVFTILVVLTPIITMRLFALEKYSGTYETLMTTSVSDIEVVLAKFSAGLIFYFVMWLPLAGCLLVVRYYANDPSALSVGCLASTFLGLVLLGGVFVALGCCASALTRSQIIAAIVTLVAGGSLTLLGFLAGNVQTTAAWQSQSLASFALFNQMQDFARGVVDTRPVVLYVSLTFLFLFLTLRLVESRRWK